MTTILYHFPPPPRVLAIQNTREHSNDVILPVYHHGRVYCKHFALARVLSRLQDAWSLQVTSMEPPSLPGTISLNSSSDNVLCKVVRCHYITVLVCNVSGDLYQRMHQVKKGVCSKKKRYRRVHVLINRLKEETARMNASSVQAP